MKTRVLVFAFGMLAPLAVRADDAYLTVSQVQTLQQRHWITPAFAAAARELIDAKLAAEQATSDQTRLEAQLPILEKSVTAEDAKLAQLKAQLDRLNHPDNADFAALQTALRDPSGAPADQLALAQAFVWTYPASPHTADAEKEVRRLQKAMADQALAEAHAAAAQTAAQTKRLLGVKAHSLSLGDWRAFLQDKTQQEVTDSLGAPTAQDADHWTYSGSWTIDPETSQKVGLSITFNGGRVQHVAPIEPAASGSGTQ